MKKVLTITGLLGLGIFGFIALKRREDAHSNPTKDPRIPNPAPPPLVQKSFPEFPAGILAREQFNKAAQKGMGKSIENLTKFERKTKSQENNNPGFIKISGRNWQGKIPLDQNTDGTFEQFESFKFGLMAFIKDLQEKFGSGSNTISLVVQNYFPINNPFREKLIQRVSEEANFPPDQPFKLNKNSTRLLIRGLEWANHSSSPISKEQFEEAWLAVGFFNK